MKNLLNKFKKETEEERLKREEEERIAAEIQKAQDKKKLIGIGIGLVVIFAIIGVMSLISPKDDKDKTAKVTETSKSEKKETEGSSEAIKESTIESTTTEESTGFEHPKYDLAYEVKFDTFSIYYLIEEATSEISTTTSMDAKLDTYKYEGNFNDGITFSNAGLDMKAHFKYWDAESKMIFKDSSGNENEGRRINPKEVEESIEKVKSEQK